MEILNWEVPVQATWHKANGLVDFDYSDEGLRVTIREEDTHEQWAIVFDKMYAVKILKNSCSKWSMETLPADEGFFELTDSPWLRALGLAETGSPGGARHFIISCHNELIEVAAEDCGFIPQ